MRLLLTIALLLLSLSSHAATITGKVVSVTDGDTITVLDANNKKHKIRLYGIDCPERSQPFGAKAKAFTSKACFGKAVAVSVKDTDRYGRKVGVVQINGKSINQAIVKAGLAWWYKQYAKNDTTLQQAELSARQDKLGIWSQPKPVAPWEWRKSKPSAAITGYWLTISSNKRHNSNCEYYRKSKGSVCGKADGVGCKICGG